MKIHAFIAETFNIFDIITVIHSQNTQVFQVSSQSDQKIWHKSYKFNPKSQIEPNRETYKQVEYKVCKKG
jgi:hypothetical protein